MTLRFILSVLALPLVFGLAATSIVFALDSDPKLTPIADVPLHEDPNLEQRLGLPVGAADIGLGIPCAVYRNGPAHQAYIPRGATVVFACGVP